MISSVKKLSMSEKLKAKFPATTLGYSMVKIANLDDAFSEIFELGESPIGQSLQEIDNKRRKKERHIKNFKKPT